jgi:hypothetical protein
MAEEGIRMPGHPMRRQDKAITDPGELEAVLHGQRLVTLAMCKDGEPYLVTMDFGYDPEVRAIFFHCADAGKKLEFLRANPRVWGQVVEDLGYIPGECDHAYRSVHFSGSVELLAVPNDKRAALHLLLRKFEPEADVAKRTEMVERSLAKVVVGKVRIEEMIGKKSVPSEK